MKTFYITTPIYYPSSALHLGHLYSTSVAWALRNYKSYRGYETLFLTGADEHGQKIYQKAFELDLTPQTYVDQQVLKTQNLWDEYLIDYDLYARTSQASHWYVVKKAFTEALEEDFIYKGQFHGLYSINDEEFVTPSQALLKEDGKYYHPQSEHELVELEEETYFFKFDKLLPWLEEEFLTPKYIPNENTIKELKETFLKTGLEDLSITRLKLEWGIPLNEDPEHIVYVWFDALFSYLSALGLWQEDDYNYRKYWQKGDEKVHLVGKEITRFHCLYWPAFLKALNFPLPTKILSHGWIITPTGKMSKSKGNGISPRDLLKDFHPEIIKWHLVANFSLTKDNVFSYESLISSYNSLLVNTFSNSIARTFALVNKYYPQGLKVLKTIRLKETRRLETFFKKSYQAFLKEADNLRLDKAYEVFHALGSSLNNYFDATKPWLFQEAENDLAEILATALEGIYLLSLLLQFTMPSFAKQVAQALGLPGFYEEGLFNRQVFKNITLSKSFHLFERK